MKTQALKGMRDLLPAEQTLRDYIQGKILETYRSAGFERISTPMLEDMENLDKSDGVLVNVTGSTDVGLEEVEIAANLVQEAADPNALIIFGATFDENMEDEICVTVIATGFDEKVMNAKSTPAAEKSAPKASAHAAEKASAPEEDDPYKEIFKIFNRDR